jgi:hypothetical protein
MNGYYIEITNNLLDPKHVKAMGAAVWEFMWCLDKITSISEEGVGVVLGGKPIKLEDIGMEIGKADNTISFNLNKLADSGYINIVRTPYGISLKVMKAKKRFKQRFTENSDSPKTEIHCFPKENSKNRGSNIRQDSDKTIKENIKEKVKPLLTATVDYLKNPPEGYISKLSVEYTIPEPFILEEKDKCLNYLAYKGKRYKDYNLFFRNWVRNSWQRLPDWKKNPTNTNTERQPDGEWYDASTDTYEFWQNNKLIKSCHGEKEYAEYLRSQGVNVVETHVAKPGEYVFKAPTTEEIQAKIKTGERKIWDF